MTGQGTETEIRQGVDELRDTLCRVRVEDELLGVIADRVETLRRAYRSQRSLFTPQDVEFLKSLRAISDHLRAFVEVKEELPTLNSLDDYDDLAKRLAQARNALAGLPVGRRVDKELRELRERLPEIRERDEERRQFRLNSRIRELEKDPPRCPRRHLMAIRDGKHGHYWGCSRHPFCEAMRPLTGAERDLLNVAH